MKPAEFESQFHQYLDHIEEAKLRKAHHDQLMKKKPPKKKLYTRGNQRQEVKSDGT